MHLSTRRLKTILFSQGRPIILCCKDDPESSKMAYKTLELPHTVDCLQGILCVIPMQLMSFHLAVLRGYDVSQQLLEIKALHMLCLQPVFRLSYYSGGYSG